MQPETCTFVDARPSASTLAQRIVAALWLAALAVIILRVPCGWHDGGVFRIYANAAARWCAGDDAYHLPSAADVYRYPPPATMLLSVFVAIPEPLRIFFWQAVNFAAFIAGFAWFSRQIIGSGSMSRNQVAALWLLLLPLSLPSLANGQVNPLMVGLLLAGLAASAAERWHVAAACIALACAIKVYPLAVALLVIITWPRKFLRPFVMALSVCCLLPFLTQPFAFVIDQWHRWLEVIAQDNRWLLPPERGYRDLWLLVQLANAPVSLVAYRFVQLTLAALVAGMCWRARHSGMSRRAVLRIVTAQASCWLILCGPSSEWPTYILLGPVLSWMTVAAWRSPRHPACLAVGSVVITFLLHATVRIFPGGAGWIWQYLPVSALALWACCAGVQLSEIKTFSGKHRQVQEERMVHGLVKA